MNKRLKTLPLHMAMLCQPPVLPKVHCGNLKGRVGLWAPATGLSLVVLWVDDAAGSKCEP